MRRGGGGGGGGLFSRTLEVDFFSAARTMPSEAKTPRAVPACEMASIAYSTLSRGERGVDCEHGKMRTRRAQDAHKTRTRHAEKTQKLRKLDSGGSTTAPKAAPVSIVYGEGRGTVKREGCKNVRVDNLVETAFWREDGRAGVIAPGHEDANERTPGEQASRCSATHA